MNNTRNNESVESNKKVAEFCSKRKLAKTIFDKQVQKEKKKNSGTVMKNYESKIKSLGEFEKVSRFLVRLLEKSLKCIFN
jgi:hypothetical protein